MFTLSCDGDPAIREGDWLRLWNSLSIGVAHDVWVGTGGIVYENSGPGGFARRNTLANVLAGRKVIHIVARTAAAELEGRVAFAESRLGTLWAAFYNCQDFASEVATGRPQSFQRDALVVVSLHRWRSRLVFESAAASKAQTRRTRLNYLAPKLLH